MSKSVIFSVYFPVNRSEHEYFNFVFFFFLYKTIKLLPGVPRSSGKFPWVPLQQKG